MIHLQMVRTNVPTTYEAFTISIEKLYKIYKLKHLYIICIYCLGMGAAYYLLELRTQMLHNVVSGDNISLSEGLTKQMSSKP